MNKLADHISVSNHLPGTQFLHPASAAMHTQPVRGVTTAFRLRQP